MVEKSIIIIVAVILAIFAGGAHYTGFSVLNSGEIVQDLEISPIEVVHDNSTQLGNISIEDFELGLMEVGSNETGEYNLGVTYEDGVFVSRWDTTKTATGSSNSTSVRLPLINTTNSSYNFTVDWGDGTSSFVNSFDNPNKTHGYASSGLYNLTINGTLVGFGFDNGPERLKIIEVMQWGNLRLGDGGSYFYGCTNLVNFSASDALNLTGTNNFGEMFRAATAFRANMGHWDTSNITNMSYMFYGTTNFNGNITDWNTSSVENMAYMFYTATYFNTSISNWDVSRVAYMNNMFNSATRFNKDMPDWNVSSVMDMNSMFYSATAFNGNISNWNPLNVKNMYRMFRQSSFNKSINNWNVSNVTNMGEMFYANNKFNQDLNNWETSKVTDMSYMFYQASAFNKSIANWNVSSVTDMKSMFYQATIFNQDMPDWDVSNVTDMSFMFYNADAFNGNISNWNPLKVTAMESMFESADVFNQSINNWNTSSVTNMGEMFDSAGKFNQDLNNWDTSKVTDMTEMFRDAPAFNGNIGSWNTLNLVDTVGMFYGASNFNNDIGSWNTSKITSMYIMFTEAEKFNQDLNNWDTSKVTTMQQMFDGCSAFNGNIGNWNTSKVTLMNYMFRLATNFNQNLTNWDTSLVTTMQYMFNWAQAFNGDITTWNVSKVTNMNNMLSEADNFNQNISGWNVLKVTDMSTMLDDAFSFNQNLGLWNVSLVTTMTNMLLDTNLSTRNYDGLLIGWASRPSLKNKVTFTAGNSMYCYGENARNLTLNQTFNWSISDGGRDPLCGQILISIKSPISTEYNSTFQNVNITINGSYNLNEYFWYNWNGTNYTYTDSLNITFAEGENTLYAWVNDSLGFTNSTNVTFEIDTITPDIEIIVPVNTIYTSAYQLLNISAEDVNLNTIWYNWNGTNYTYTTFLNITFTEGENIIHAWANDTLGFLNYTNVTFEIDTITPNLQIISPINITYDSANQSLNISAEDVHLGTTWYNWNGTNYTYTTFLNITFAEGENIIHAWANDTLGFLNYTNVTFEIDTNPPNITIVGYTPTLNSTQITWDTNEGTNSTINYGINETLGNYEFITVFNVTTSILLGGLNESTTYYYNITSCDAIGNCITYGPFNFTTTTPVTSFCGNGVCDTGESCSSCPGDCGSCSIPIPPGSLPKLKPERIRPRPLPWVPPATDGPTEIQTFEQQLITGSGIIKQFDMNITPIFIPSIICNGLKVSVGDYAFSMQTLATRFWFRFDFSKDKEIYCPWCYNGKQDYDEFGIDCGPSCNPCKKIEYRKSSFWEIYQTTITATLFLIIVLFLSLWVIKSKNRKQPLKNKSLNKRLEIERSAQIKQKSSPQTLNNRFKKVNRHIMEIKRKMPK